MTTRSFHQVDDQAEEESYRPPKLPRTMTEKDASKRLIVVLEGASLETVKVYDVHMQT